MFLNDIWVLENSEIEKKIIKLLKIAIAVIKYWVVLHLNKWLCKIFNSILN